MLSAIALLALLFVLRCESLAPQFRSTTVVHKIQEHAVATSRRSILSLPFLVAIPPVSWALDFDAFITKELTEETPELTSDEALCKYGQPALEKGEACVRAGISPTNSKGGVDAYGKVDRGNFVRCKNFYDLENGKYVKKQCVNEALMRLTSTIMTNGKQLCRA